MKRYDGLWEQLTSFRNLLFAARRAHRGKRHRPGVAAFDFNLENELCRLQRELRQRCYAPGAYTSFQILEPKPRLISAAPFRDRVVHHALCRVLELIFAGKVMHAPLRGACIITPARMLSRPARSASEGVIGGSLACASG